MPKISWTSVLIGVVIGVYVVPKLPIKLPGA